METWIPVEYTAVIKVDGIPGHLEHRYTITLRYVENGSVKSTPLDLKNDAAAFAAWISVLSTGRAEMNAVDFAVRLKSDPKRP